MGNKPKRLNMNAIKAKPHQIISSEEALKDVEPMDWKGKR
jgi:hypothetical protein